MGEGGGDDGEETWPYCCSEGGRLKALSLIDMIYMIYLSLLNVICLSCEMFYRYSAFTHSILNTRQILTEN